MLARPVDVFIRIWCTVSNTIIVASLIHDSSYFFLVAVCSSYFFGNINNYFSKVLQILGDFVPQTRGFAPGPHYGTSVPQTPDLGPPVKNFQRRPCSWFDLTDPDPLNFTTDLRQCPAVGTALSGEETDRSGRRVRSRRKTRRMPRLLRCP